MYDLFADFYVKSSDSQPKYTVLLGSHYPKTINEMENLGFSVDPDSTPGFVDYLKEVKEDELQDYYPDIARYKGRCYYDNCRHLKEPDCAVKTAVKAGEISRVRYRSYKSNMEEIKEKRKY